MRQDSFNHPHFQGGSGRPPTGALRVPFGLKDGRMWSPKQVPSGLACGCVCPACQARLIAKAADSQVRRPHFAHLVETDCRAGYETALHKKAKELLLEHATLLLPAWDGEEGMPNPPSEVDDAGRPLVGRRVEFPAREVDLLSVQLEMHRGDYIPDVVATDAQGELLIEIRVTHAVDPLKRQRIQSEGKRLVEIDLSKLDPDLVLDEVQFLHLVLKEPSNRYWLSCPEATEDWRASYRDLKAALAERNQEIARLRQQQKEAQEGTRREQQAAYEKVMAREAEQEAKKEQFREEERARYREELEDLPTLVSPERIETLLEEYQVRDQVEAERLIAQIPEGVVRHLVRYGGPNAWIYQVHPTLWQAACYHHFVVKQAQGPQFNQRDAARWVMQQFGREEALYTLFKAQYVFRDRARKAGFHKRRISFWAFTDLENQQIPNFYQPINNLVDRLVCEKVLQRVPGILGEVRVGEAN